MNDISKYKYVHIGNDKISYTQFLDIINDKEKPYGSFWACPFNNVEGSISDRTDYILENEDGKFLRFNETKGCLFNLKKEANIFKIIHDEDFNKAIGLYNNNGYIDYETMSKEYDALFVNPYPLSRELRYNHFDTWNVRSLVVFNKYIIEEYLPIEFKYVRNSGFYIETIGESSKIEELPNIFWQLKSLVYQLFIEKQKQYSDKCDFDMIIVLESIKKELMKYFIESLDDKNYDIVETMIINECTRQKKKIGSK